MTGHGRRSRLVAGLFTASQLWVTTMAGAGGLTWKHLGSEEEVRALIGKNGGELYFSSSVSCQGEGPLHLVLRAPAAFTGEVEPSTATLEAWPDGQSLSFGAQVVQRDYGKSGLLQVFPSLTSWLGVGRQNAGLSSMRYDERFDRVTDLFLIARSDEEYVTLHAQDLTINEVPVLDQLLVSAGSKRRQDALWVSGWKRHDIMYLRGHLIVRWPRDRKVPCGGFALEIWGAHIMHDDHTPPRVAIEKPENGAVVWPIPDFRVHYEDDGTGIDPESVELWLDDHNLAAHAEVGPSGLELRSLGRLRDGAHHLVVLVSDRSGNEGRAEVRFSVKTGAPELRPSSVPNTGQVGGPAGTEADSVLHTVPTPNHPNESAGH